MKIELKIPSMKARVFILCGEYEDIKSRLPFKNHSFGDKCYLARTEFKRLEHQKYAFNIVIHSRTAAISVIAHEAVHAACFIQNAMGCVADFDNDEYTAYLVQYICEEAEMALKVYDN